MRYSCSTYMLYLGLRERLDLRHHTICISSRYEENLRDISERGCLSAEPSMYFCNPSGIDPTMAPRGKSAVYCLVPTPNARCGLDWAASAPTLRRHVIEGLSRQAGRDVEGLIAGEIQITPDDWRASRIAFGATFNLAHSLSQMLHRRPQQELPDVEGVWLTGGGTHPGSGLPVIFLSSQAVARRMCEKTGLKYAGDHGPSPRAVRAREAEPATV
jgi:phytoene desaturase